MRSTIDAEKIEKLVNLEELPGADLILLSLEDLRNGKTKTIGVLLITIASTRLTAASLVFPKDQLVCEPELALYHRLEKERSDAYSYYNSLLNSLNSFCNALELKQSLQNKNQSP